MQQKVELTSKLVLAAAILAISVGFIPTIGMAAWAASIQCQPLPVICYGTEQSDDIKGTKGPDFIYALGGDDIVEAGDAVTGNNTVFAGDGNDVVRGGNGFDVLLGLDGSDTISGGGGDDLLNGHGGDDKIDGGSGDDAIGGGLDNNRLDGGNGDDHFNAYTGADSFRCGGGIDTIENFNPAEGDTKTQNCENF